MSQPVSSDNDSVTQVTRQKRRDTDTPEDAKRHRRQVLSIPAFIIERLRTNLYGHRERHMGSM